MSFLGKKYVCIRMAGKYSCVKQENFDGFLKFFGAPAERIEQVLKFAPAQTLLKDGDTYTSITVTPQGSRETKFKSGVEFDDVIGLEMNPIKATCNVDGNTVTYKIIASPEKGTTTFKREYNGDDLVETITVDKWDGVAKVFYKAS